METNQSKGEHWSAGLLSLSPRPQTALFLIVRVKESEVALSGAGATYRAPIICLDKVLGGTKAAWWWQGWNKPPLYRGLVNRQARRACRRTCWVSRTKERTQNTNYKNLCIKFKNLCIQAWCAAVWFQRGGETTASCAEVSAPTLQLVPTSNYYQVPNQLVSGAQDNGIKCPSNWY